MEISFHSVKRNDSYIVGLGGGGGRGKRTLNILKNKNRQIESITVGN